MIVRVRLFALIRELAGQELVALEVPAGATVATVRAKLLERYPEANRLAAHLIFAVGTEYADDNTALAADAELACIPPVSGG